MARLARSAAATALLIAVSWDAFPQRSYAFNVQFLRRPAQNYSTPIPTAPQTTPQYRPPIWALQQPTLRAPTLLPA